jgi:hypothetical protein
MYGIRYIDSELNPRPVSELGRLIYAYSPFTCSDRTCSATTGGD